MADATQIAQYLTTLFEKSDVVGLCFIHESKTFSAGNAFTENRFVPLADVVSSKGIARLIKRNEAGWNCFVSMAPFKKGSETRTKGNISEVRHAFLDIDEEGDERLADVRAAVAKGEIPKPTVVICSSPHKFQIVWNVEGLTVAEVEALNKNLVLRFKGDPASTDVARILRLPGLRNRKPKYPDKPLATIVERHVQFLPITIEDFCIPQSVLPDNTVYGAPDNEAVAASAALLEAAMAEAKVVHGRAVPWDGGRKYSLETCPWSSAHTNGRPSDAVAIVQNSGAFTFVCLHSHCASRSFADFRKHLEATAGKRLKFGTKKSKVAKTQPTPRGAA